MVALVRAGFWLESAGRRSHIVGSGLDTQGDRGITLYRPCGGSVEVSDGGS